MREVLLFTIDGQQYGVWKDQIISVEIVGAVHRLPFLKSSLTVLAVIGDRTRTLADLPSCLGHEQAQQKGKASALVMSDQGQVRGFLLSADLSHTRVQPQSFIPLPDYLRIPFTEGFLSQDGELVPVVAVRALFEHVLKEGRLPQIRAWAFGKVQPAEPVNSVPLKLVTAGGDLLAIRTPELTARPPGSFRISRFPLLSADIEGLAMLDNHLVPVMDLARRVSHRNPTRSPLLVEARVGSAAVGLLVDGTRGEWEPEDTLVKDLPPISRTPWLRSAAVHGERMAAIIDIPALLASSEDTAHPEAIAESYAPASSFPSQFRKEDVELVELLVTGRRYAIPKAEAIDVVAYTPTHTIPHGPELVAGIAACDGELLPVLDLSRVQGGSATPTPEWRMILLSNGNFRALVLAEKVPETKLLKVAAQKEVPVVLPYPVVYGCYTDGESVRLILNVHALALHFEESRATELLPPLTPVESVREQETEKRTASEQPMQTIVPHVEEVLQPPAAKAENEEIPAALPALEESASRENRKSNATQSVALPTEPSPPRGQMEEERSIEEPAVAEMTAPSQPVRRGWRMLVAFIASIILIAGVVVGVNFSGLVRKPQLTSNETGPQVAAAVAKPALVHANAPQPQSTPVYVVKEGDTLWDISQRLTGDPFNYRSIAGQNRIPNPDLIFPGQTLLTPPDSRSSR